jgi:hypothetical protein
VEKKQMNSDIKKSSDNQNKYVRRTNFFDVNKQKPQKAVSVSGTCDCPCLVSACACDSCTYNKCSCDCKCVIPYITGQGLVSSAKSASISDAQAEKAVQATSSSNYARAQAFVAQQVGTHVNAGM